MRITLPLTLGAVLAFTIATHAGGWAVVTVEDLPHQLIAGKATTLTYSVRQHGMRLLPGLSGGVSARSGKHSVTAAAVPADRAGYYTASLTLPSAGEWTITIHSGFVTSNLTLMPITTVAAADAAAASPAPAAQRGEKLFVAKGCNSCHYHGATKATPIVNYGANLTDKRYPDEFLAALLKDPSRLPPANGMWEMPNLNLRQQEIDALVAFINKRRPD